MTKYLVELKVTNLENQEVVLQRELGDLSPEALLTLQNSLDQSQEPVEVVEKPTDSLAFDLGEEDPFDIPLDDDVSDLVEKTDSKSDSTEASQVTTPTPDEDLELDTSDEGNDEYDFG